MQENHRSLLRFKLAHQQGKVLDEINLYEKLLLEYSDQLNRSFSARTTRSREFLIPPHINENHNWDQNFCDGTLTAVTNVMGIENFLKKIRALFTSNRSGGEDNDENSRKRRFVEQQRLPLKYRRIDYNLPEYIPMSQQDDDDCVLTGAAYNSLNSHSSQTQSAATTTSGITNGPVKYNLHRSMFDAPQTTRKIIQCRNVTDIKLSDDEDDLYQIYVKQKNNTNDGIRGNRKSELTCDLTLGSTNWTTTAKKAHGRPPPPLRRIAKPRSASVVHNSEYLHCSRSVSSLEAPSAESTFTLVNSFWPAIPHRAGIQERDAFDHEEYLRLLQKNMPRVYCSSSNEEIKDKQHIIKCTKQRLSAECEIGQPPFSSTTINIDGAYDKQEIRKFVIDDDDDIVEIDKRHATATLSDSCMHGNINLRGQRTSVQVMCKTKTNQHTQHKVDLTNDDDDDTIIEEILDINGVDVNLDDDDVLVIDTKAATENHNASVSHVPKVSPVNTLADRLRNCELMKEDWASEFEVKWGKICKSNQNESQLIESEIEHIYNVREKCRKDALASLFERQISLKEKPSFPIEVKSSVSDEYDDIILELTEAHLQLLHSYLKAPDNKVLVYKFNLSITRHDIYSLCNTNWLNDSVINFYMNLLTERSEQRPEMPAVYAMNTFFVQRLMNGGYAAVKRWTRKVDIFAKDIIPVPVHVGGVHWCMAIIHLKQKRIQYYDSMGQPNNNVLKALEVYLQEESLDKRKQSFDTREFQVESVPDSPRQTNGSDCGVFSCMTAEYITRGRPITFSQADMKYFRQKMILEIVGGQLWH